MNAAKKNARRLVADAELMFKSERYPSAAALAILAIEEAGKNTILRQIATASDADKLKKAWKDFRSHKEKNLASIVPQLVARGARVLEDFLPMVDERSSHPIEVDAIKQLAVYTDCLGDGRWSEPDVVIDKDLAHQLVMAANTLASSGDTHIHTAREVELWVEHIGPVIDKPLNEMKTALLNWYNAMRSEGLTDTDATSVEQFLMGDGDPAKPVA